MRLCNFEHDVDQNEIDYRWRLSEVLDSEEAVVDLYT